MRIIIAIYHGTISIIRGQGAKGGKSLTAGGCESYVRRWARQRVIGEVCSCPHHSLACPNTLPRDSDGIREGAQSSSLFSKPSVLREVFGSPGCGL